MRLLFQQRLFSWFDSYDIYDEEGRTVYTVEGKLSWGHRLEIYGPAGDHLGTVKEEVLTFLPRFSIYVEGDTWGTFGRSSPSSSHGSSWSAAAGRWTGTSGSGTIR